MNLIEFAEEVRHFAVQIAILTVLLALVGWPISQAMVWLVGGR